MVFDKKEKLTFILVDCFYGGAKDNMPNLLEQ